MSTGNTVYLCSAKRTAIGSFNGSLAKESATNLAAKVMQAVLAESEVPIEKIDEVILGCVLMAGLGQAPARQAMIAAGLPKSVQAMTINKVCSSGLKAIMLAANEIALGNAEAILAGGMENMTRAPYLMPSLRAGARLGHTEVQDSLLTDALWDVYKDFHMGNAAELCAAKYELSRQQQDEFAIESYQRAKDAISAGKFEKEIVPIETKVGREKIEFKTDEEPPKGKPEKIPNLRPAFQKDGTITAANASSINDGASVMLVCSEKMVKELGLNPQAKIISQGWHGQEPEWFTTAPVGAMNNALSKADLKVDDIDLFEINEAFSAVALACSRDLKVPLDKLNVNGGAVALGHPVGASGARILTTLLYAMAQRDVELGAVAICNGGGEATSMVVQRC